MITALAAKGGVIQINFFDQFLDNDLYQATVARQARVQEIRTSLEQRYPGETNAGAGSRNCRRRRRRCRRCRPSSWEKIVEHIDHVVKLVGPTHVGLGSDFDGASMPGGMEDCSQLPKITAALAAARLLGAGRAEHPGRERAAADGAGRGGGETLAVRTASASSRGRRPRKHEITKNSVLRLFITKPRRARSSRRLRFDRQLILNLVNLLRTIVDMRAPSRATSPRSGLRSERHAETQTRGLVGLFVFPRVVLIAAAGSAGRRSHRHREYFSWFRVFVAKM